ncbi:MAG: LytTR family DNA-binding domain-containing protein [Crocinitomicaceae bacterium]
MEKRFKAILIDDERSARNILSRLLELHCPEIDILDTCKNLEEGVQSIKTNKPELVFLDIEMPNYAGYEIGSFFDEIDFEIIFVTAYDSYAIKAFEMSALDYLLKPIDIDRLKFAVQKFISEKEKEDASINYQVLLESLSEDRQQKIVVQVKGGQKAIALKDIVALEASSAYCTIHTIDEGSFLYSKHLKYFEDLLEDEKNFIRTHKSWIINSDYLEQYSKSKFTIQLNNGIEAKLSKYKKEVFESSILS